MDGIAGIDRCSVLSDKLLGLQEYGKLLYGEDEPHVELFDEGAGVSGQKRIDEREELDRLYRNMNQGIIGQLVMAREDRLFRNKHNVRATRDKIAMLLEAPLCSCLWSFAEKESSLPSQFNR
jgi:hypothetical protein